MTKIASAVTAIAAWMIAKSRWMIESIISLPTPGKPNTVLDDHGAIDDARGLIARDRDHRQHGVAERVHEDDGALLDALGARS